MGWLCSRPTAPPRQRSFVLGLQGPSDRSGGHLGACARVARVQVSRQPERLGARLGGTRAGDLISTARICTAPADFAGTTKYVPDTRSEAREPGGADLPPASLT